jgi:hypothetical protein
VSSLLILPVLVASVRFDPGRWGSVALATGCAALAIVCLRLEPTLAMPSDGPVGAAAGSPGTVRSYCVDMSADVSVARRLAGALEPVAGQAQFSPECHRNYAALGFPPSPGTVGSTALPEKCSFFTARGSVLGDVPAEVIAAAFAVFNPDEIVPLVRRGQALADAATMWAARLDGAAAQLRRILGPSPDRVDWVSAQLLEAAQDLPLAGRSFFAAQRAAAIPDDPVGRLWRAADRLREFRGDSHIQVWSAAGFDPLEIGLLSDQFWGLAPRAHTAGRGWTATQLDAGEDRLRTRGLLDATGRLTEQGRTEREAIEVRTDAALAPAIAALGDDVGELLSTLEPWGRSIRDAGGYLTPLVRFTFDTD